MSSANFDLDRYLARIGYAGPRAPTLAVLGEVQGRHASSIAFENLDVLLGRPARTDPGALQRKLVEGSRGGYCFEQNGLLLGALEALGFHVAPMQARVLWQRTGQPPLPRSHMLLRVDPQDAGPQLVDVGHGGCTPTGPLALDSVAPQATPLESFRLVDSEGERQLEVWLATGQGWSPVYRFRPEPVLLVDCEPANWFHSTCPASPFTQHLMVARPGADRRHGLRDTAFTVRHRGGHVERRVLPDGAALLAVLEDVFLLRFPEAAERRLVRARLDRIAASQP